MRKCDSARRIGLSILIPVFVLLSMTADPTLAQKKSASTTAKAAPKFLRTIANREGFDQLSRTYYKGRFYALPHVMFVIDRASKGTVYYVNSKLYSFHKDFVNGTYLSLERGKTFFQHNYLEENRRFVLGTIAWHADAGKFTFELWEGDNASESLLTETFELLRRTFYGKLYFKPNSDAQQERASRAKGLETATTGELGETRDFLPVNEGKAVGVLRIIDRVDADTIIDRNEIVIFKESPVTLTPLTGVITVNPASPLSHVNLLTKGWGIPNASIAGADQLYSKWVGKFVYLEVREDGYVVRPAELNETLESGRELAKRSDLLTPAADLDYKELQQLSKERKADAMKFGSKASNLGELFHAMRQGRLTGVSIPEGFSVPFFYYQQFIEQNGIEAEIVAMLGNDRFNHNPRYRREELARLRERIRKGRLSEDFRALLQQRVTEVFGSLSIRGVFARSSTNSEDLPNFSGAGLYTSVPNVKSEAALEDAIRVVWASLWNYEAYEARESAGINHSAVYPAVLVQEGIDAEAAGVMITTDPFNRRNSGAIYINAKRGLGIRVVEGEKLAEQLLVSGLGGGNPRIKVLSRSGDDTMLRFDEAGGVKEVRIEASRAVLTDELSRNLGRAALMIKRSFNGRDQDIEWVVRNGRIYIVQSRPFVRGN